MLVILFQTIFVVLSLKVYLFHFLLVRWVILEGQEQPECLLEVIGVQQKEWMAQKAKRIVGQSDHVLSRQNLL